MFRLSRRVAVCLIVGAIVNVAVAWACVCWSPIGSFSDVEERAWAAPVPDGWPATASPIAARGLGLTDTNSSSWGNVPADAERKRGDSEQWVLSAGWPRRSLFCERHRVRTRGPSLFSVPYPAPESWTEGLSIPEWVPWQERDFRYLPTRPIWAGFAINTVFYGGAVGLVWFGLGAARQAVRRWRGRCVNCAYDLRGNTSGVCPECGAAIQGRRCT